MIGLVWAQARGGVIGAGGAIPWRIPEDMRRFREVTVGSPVVMGRRTWDSLPARFRPLPGRTNIVVTRDRAWHADGAYVAGGIDEALRHASASGGEVWVIGGGEVYRAAICRADVLEVTEVDGDYSGDAFGPPIDPAVFAVAQETPWLESAAGPRYRFVTYRRISSAAG